MKRVKQHIDFSILSGPQLQDLSDKWEREAMGVEKDIDYLSAFKVHRPDQQERLNKLWQVANNLWRRLNILESWRRRNATLSPLRQGTHPHAK